jgi:hypothetical protein
MKLLGTKHIILFFVLISVSNLTYSQSNQDFFEEFESLIDDEKPSLLPKKMIFTQKILWGRQRPFKKNWCFKSYS